MFGIAQGWGRKMWKGYEHFVFKPNNERRSIQNVHLKDAKITFSFYRQSSHVKLWPNFIEKVIKVIKICSFNLKIPLELLVLESAFLSLNMSYLP